MTGVCPQGHASDDPDWCDVCGLALTRAAAPTATGATRCAACGADLDGRFCEVCGHDSAAPLGPGGAPSRPFPTGPSATGPSPTGSSPTAPPSTGPLPTAPPTPAPPTAWRAVVRADRAWFDEVRRQDGVDAATLDFPHYAPERRFALSGPRVTIGRRSAARGIEPDVDLTGLDPAVSSAHAVLLARPDGGWDVVDVGSTNGTTLAVEDGPLPAHRPVPLADGAVIRLGAWTTITVTRAQPGA